MGKSVPDCYGNPVAGLLGFAANFFLIGEPVDGEQLCCTVSQENPNLEMQVGTAESGMALRGWKRRQEGKTCTSRPAKCRCRLSSGRGAHLYPGRRAARQGAGGK